ncbi:MAG TPA: hypothetical protein VM680_18495 [Verrucomicrobiae bacterium]|nr:hypothetical protein [Verrucomicrobiae bacterium]
MAKLIKADLVTAAAAETESAQRIIAFHRGAKRSAAQQLVYAFLAGVELNAIKEEIAHGHFMKWCEANVPGIQHRTLTKYMGIAEVLQTKLNTLADFDLPRLQLTNGEIKEEQIESVSEAVREVITAKNLTELYRDYGLVPEKIEQKDRKRGDKLTPEQADEERRANAKNFLVTLCGDLETFSTDNGKLHADLDTPDLKDLQKSILSASRILRDLLKARSKGTGKKKGGRK